VHRIEVAIRAEADKLIRRHELYCRELDDENKRRRRRSTGSVAILHVQRPSYWSLAAGFNPYLVRARASRIAPLIRARLTDRSYKPHSPSAYHVPKPDGSNREVSVFQVADSAVSRLIFESLLEKNRPRLSARAYAYRKDLSAHDALQYMQSEFAQRERLFVAEYDFSKYFDTIDHEHIWRTLEEGRFLLTDVERHVIEAFLTAPLPSAHDYQESGGKNRDRGIPQGTSISLFLANVAASPLDRALERLGVGFVRYADDTVIWSSDYGQICKAVDELYSASSHMGSELNPEKSEGIRLLLAGARKGEIEWTDHVDFVGYAVRLHELDIKSAVVGRIRQHIEDLLYHNLLVEPVNGTQARGRLGRVDRDYVTFIWQLRRYLYGDLNEREVRKYEARGTRLRRFRGVMSYYPLLDDTEVLAELDRWLATAAWLTMRRRASLLKASGYASLPPPHDLSRDELIHFTRRSGTTGGILDLRMPSFRRISRVIRRAATTFGPNAVGQGSSPYDYSGRSALRRTILP
jgi:RNA-directed DNA polymerase